MKIKVSTPRLGVFFLIAAMLLLAGASAIAQNTRSANPLYNPNQVATLRWYNANQTPTLFTVGGGTDGIAFDGANMWVGSYESGMLTKLSLNGKVLATIPLGGTPLGLAYDGANIWVANTGLNTLHKINIADPSKSPPPFTYDDLGAPYQLAFDGTDIWVACFQSNTVLQIRASDGTKVNSFKMKIHPTGLAFDGECIWAVDSGEPNGITGEVRVLAGSSAKCRFAGRHWDTGWANPYGIVYDGTNIWVGNEDGNNVVVFDGVTGKGIIKTIPVGTYPRYLAFDGAFIWVANQDSVSVSKLMASNNPFGDLGTKVGEFPVTKDNPGIHHGPQNLAFDGANIWVTLGGDLVQKF